MRDATLLEKVLVVFDDGRRGRAALLSLLLFFGALLETCGVGLIMPFIAVISSPGMLHDNPVLAKLYELSPVTDEAGFFWMFALFMLGFYVFKNVCLGLIAHFSNGVIYRRMYAVSTRLLGKYMSAPYAFHMENPSSDLQRNINHDVIMTFNWVVAQSFILVGDALIITVMLTMLLVVEPVATLAAVSIIAVSGGLFLLVTRKQMARCGEDERRQFGLMIKWVNQGLGGIKEAKILGKERYFVDMFEQHGARFSRIRKTMLTVNELPRLFLETVAVGSMLVVIVATIMQGDAIQSVLPALAMFAAAAFRLIPATTRVIRATNFIRHHRASLDQVWRDLAGQSTGPDEAGAADGSGSVAFTESIALEGVDVRYGKEPDLALRAVDLVIRKGEAVAFVGRSGAGKTTVVDVILGLLTPERGRLLVDGRDVAACRGQWRRRFGYIPQQIYIIDDSIRRNVAFGMPGRDIDDERVWGALETAQIAAFVRSLPDGLDTELGENGVRLSGGQRQRIGIARALYPDPDVLILDEATAALDAETEAAVSDAVASLAGERTLIVVAHRMSTVERCDRLFFLQDGALVAAGTYGELLADCPGFAAMAGLRDAAPVS